MSAHGTVDQGTTPAVCDPFAFGAGVTSPDAMRQEFVPASPGLAGVDLCVRGESGPTEIHVIIRSGSAGDAGESLGGSSATIGTGYEYVHIDFPTVIEVTPGEKHVIELQSAAPALSVTWRGLRPDVDDYAPGGSSAPAAVSDFAFRTYAGDLAPPPTPQATASRTPTRTPTRTASPTATTPTPPPPQATPTLPPVAPTAAPSSVAQEVPTPSIGATGATPARTVLRPAGTATRTPATGVLGRANRRTTLRPPDVGSEQQGEDGGSGAGLEWAYYVVPAAFAAAGALAGLRLRNRRR